MVHFAVLLGFREGILLENPKMVDGCLVFPTSKWWVMMIMYDVMVMFHYQCGAIILDINGSVRKYIVSSKWNHKSWSLGSNCHAAHIMCQLQPVLKNWTTCDLFLQLTQKTAHVSKFQSLEFTKHIPSIWKLVLPPFGKKTPATFVRLYPLTGSVSQQCSRDVPHPSPKAVEWPAFPKNQRLSRSFMRKETGKTGVKLS